MRRILIIGILLMYQGVATAQYVTVVGSGINSCRKWLSDRRTHSDWHQTGQWINGFYTGVQAGLVGKVNFRKVDSSALWGYVDKYCAANPLKEIHDASNQLLLYLKEDNNR